MHLLKHDFKYFVKCDHQNFQRNFNNIFNLIRNIQLLNYFILYLNAMIQMQTLSSPVKTFNETSCKNQNFIIDIGCTQVIIISINLFLTRLIYKLVICAENIWCSLKNCWRFACWNHFRVVEILIYFSTCLTLVK